MINPVRKFMHHFFRHEWKYGGPIEDNGYQIGVWIRCEYPGCDEIYDDMRDQMKESNFDETEYP